MQLQIAFFVQSICILLLFYAGLFWRKQVQRHIKIMSIAIGWDLLLVLQIEFTRSAIKKALGALQNPALLNIHVSIAVSTVILYFVLIVLGRRLLKGDNSVRTKHRFFGWLTILLRSLVLITSFMVASQRA